MKQHLTSQVKQAALDVGFDVVGISKIESGNTGEDTHSPPSPPHHGSPPSLFQRLNHWLDAGFHGAMAWMAQSPDRRASPSLVLPGCRSLVSVGLNYFTDSPIDEQAGTGRIARYAWGRDYHRIFDKKLKRLEEVLHSLAPTIRTRRYVDTGPVMEKAWAQQAGIGWIGKHSNLVSADFGSWLLLGEILTTADLQPDEAGSDLCGSCSLCIQACPTGAITEPYIVDSTKCLSYLTIEFRGTKDEVGPELQKQMGNRIFGCDDCLDICPYNNMAQPSKESGFLPTAFTPSPNLLRLREMTEQDFNESFQGSPIRRAKHSGMQRNLQIALKNSSNSTEGVTASRSS